MTNNEAKQQDIFFRKTGKVSGMCNSYMQIEYKDKLQDMMYKFDRSKPIIYLEDDVVKISFGGLSVGIDCSKKDKKWFRLFYNYYPTDDD